MRPGLGVLVLALALGAGGAPEPRDLRFVRGLEMPAGGSVDGTGRTCAVLDETLYAHAAAALADVRLFAGGREVPYALTMSETAPRGDVAEVFNLGMQGGRVVFELRMPERAYTSVDLDLGGRNFLATAKVTGLRRVGDARGTLLGSFTLFDLSGQRLGRSTAISFAESTFPVLRVELAFSGAAGGGRFVAGPEVMRGAEVPPSREAQTLYTTVAETGAMVQRGRESVAEFEVAAHVPVERVSFVVGAGGNFSRGVRITARASGSEAAAVEEVRGEVARVRLTEAGREVREERLGVPATLGSNGQGPARVEVAVENGDDQPLAIRAVRLEMRQRKLCFDAGGGAIAMYYGDGGLQAPVYDYSRLFSPGERAAEAKLGLERVNPEFVARVARMGFMERHPAVIWVALLGVVAVLGGMALRTARGIPG